MDPQKQNAFSFDTSRPQFAQSQATYKWKKMHLTAFNSLILAALLRMAAATPEINLGRVAP